MDRAILYVNPLTFPIAVERRVTARLAGRPVVLAPGGTDRAVVWSASPEASLAGVTVGMPIYQALRRCPDLVILPPRLSLYRRAADALEAILRPVVPVIEPHTLGHAYGDLTGTRRLFGPAIDVAARIRRDIWGRLGLPVTVGVAGNKVVSEVAAHVLKPEPVVDVRPGEEPAFLAPHPLAALPGAEDKIREQLARYNVTRIGALAVLPHIQVEGVLGRRGAVLHARARGIDPRPVLPAARGETLAARRILAAQTNDRDLLHAELRTLAEELGRGLRARRATADRLELRARYADHRDAAVVEQLEPATDLDVELTAAAARLAARAITRRTALSAVGLVATLGAGHDVQLSLFDLPPPSVRRRDLNAALDRVRRRYGTASIWYGTGEGGVPGH
jgi:DNA polymerase-4